MNFRIISILFCVGLSMCSPAKQENLSNDTTQQVAQVAPSEPSATPNSDDPDSNTPNSVNLKETALADLPAELKTFIADAQDQSVSNLEKYIHPTLGSYVIEEGPGVYPIVKEAKSVEDLNNNTQFLLFSNSPPLQSGYYLNVDGLDLCDPPAEGIFFSTAEKKGHLLLTAYQSHFAASNEQPGEALIAKLNTLDSSYEWYCLINLPSNAGELNRVDIYLAKIDDKFYIAAVDTRSCGL